jgi:hypothetical protein
VFNDDAELVGIEPDAPQKAKESYEQHVKMLQKAEEDMCKL